MDHLSNMPCLYLVAYRLYSSNVYHVMVFSTQEEVEKFVLNSGVIVLCVDTLNFSVCFGKEEVASEKKTNG